MTFDDTASTTNATTVRGPSHGPAFRPMALLDPWLSRVGLRTPFTRDLALAVIACLVSLGLLWAVTSLAEFQGTPFAPVTMAALTALVLLQSLAVCVRSLSPLLCLSVVVATQIAMYAVLSVDVSYLGVAPFIAGYTCATRIAPPRLLWVLGTAVVVQAIGGFVAVWSPLTAITDIPGIQDPMLIGSGRAFSTVIAYGAMGFIGLWVATRRSFVRVERLRAIEAIRAHQERANGAVRAERARMARELHDIAAHNLSGMVVQAGAAEQLIGRDDRAAKETTAWIRSQGKETLDSLRMVVSALRDLGEPEVGLGTGGDSHMDSSPVPGVGGIDRLVESERALGATVDVTRNGSAYQLPPVADVTFYRVAQEALSNARDHAPGARVDVTLHHAQTEAVLCVENAPSAAREERQEESRGLGLVGMRERAQLIGAVLESGPTDSGGWRVRLTLPSMREISTGGVDRAAVKERHDQGGPG